MASFLTNRGKKTLLDVVSAGSTKFRLLLVNTPPANAHAAAILNTVSEVTANELSTSGTNYARVTLASVTTVEDDTNGVDRVVFSAANPATYTAISAGTIAGAWVHYQVGGSPVDSTDPLIGFLDCTDLVTNGGDVTLAFDSTNGILTLA